MLSATSNAPQAPLAMGNRGGVCEDDKNEHPEESLTLRNRKSEHVCLSGLQNSWTDFQGASAVYILTLESELIGTMW